jgi:hypothetical protein
MQHSIDNNKLTEIFYFYLLLAIGVLGFVFKHFNFNIFGAFVPSYVAWQRNGEFLCLDNIQTTTAVLFPTT